MRPPTRPLAILAALALFAVLGTGIASAEPPSPAPSDFLYTGCSQDAVTPAPTGEKDSKGQAIVPTPGADGTAMPVILVHGWTGDPSTFEHPANLFGDGGDGGAPLAFTASITGRLQAIPGVAVYDFDYSEYASRWVTDPNIGPKLAKAVECLTSHFGRKASIIAHSMGGLATRFALAQKDTAGQPVSARIAEVATFGTPNTGSDVAAAMAQLAGNATTDVLNGQVNVGKEAVAAAWVFLQACGREYTAGTSQATGPCAAIPAFVTSLDSDAGRALRTGSSELAALPSWPSGLPVQAVEGTISLRGLSLFGTMLDGDPSINLGDVPVANASAVTGATSTVDEPCSLQVFGRDGSLQYVQEGDIRGGAISRTKVMESPCFHGNLMRTLNGVNPVVQTIRTAAGNAASLALQGPASAPPTAGSGAAANSGAAPGAQKWFSLANDVTREITYQGGQYDMRTATIRTTDYPNSEVFRLQGHLAAEWQQNWIDYALSGKCAAFETGMGISTKATNPAQRATFTVFVDGVQKAQTTLGYYDEPQNIHLDVTGASRLRIRLDFPGNNATAAVWGTPRIYCTDNPSPS